MSGGIDVSGASGNMIITGNKIGTDITGLVPLGNKTLGLRIKGSGGHTIGGPGLERNIISANGSSLYDHEQNTVDVTKFDWYNSCGIYLFNVSNSTIKGNYIGVDATGNNSTVGVPYDMGNFYVGIKIDGNSSGNTVGVAGAGNIIGGNGFRSTAEATLKGYINLDGHGMIIKDKNTLNTKV